MDSVWTTIHEKGPVAPDLQTMALLPPNHLSNDFGVGSIQKTANLEKPPISGNPKKLGMVRGQAIRIPTFRRFARIDSCESIRKKIPIFEALGQIRANRVFSPIRIEIRVICVLSSMLSHVLEGRFAKKKRFF